MVESASKLKETEESLFNDQLKINGQTHGLAEQPFMKVQGLMSARGTALKQQNSNTPSNFLSKQTPLNSLLQGQDGKSSVLGK